MLSESSCFGYSSDDPFPGGSLLVWTEDVEWSILIPNPLMKTYSLPPNSETGRSAGMEDFFLECRKPRGNRGNQG